MYSKSFIICFGVFICISLNTLSFEGIKPDKHGNTNLFTNEKIYSIPNYIVLNDTSRVIELLYEGPRYKESPTKVFAYYSNPDLLRGIKASGKQYPGIVLLHGGGGTAFKEWVELWAAEGFAAIAMDMSGSGKDRIPLTNGGPKGDTQHKFNEIKNGPAHTWSYYSICSILKAHSLLRSFPEVDTTNTFISGISWGGYLTCMVVGIDNRYKAAAPVYGCGYFDLMEGPRERLNELPEKEKNNWLEYLDPSVYLPNARCKMFFINGNKDFFFNL
jgi:dipeptidyl aminopeptidase/acylaminoacyl peptidase